MIEVYNLYNHKAKTSIFENSYYKDNITSFIDNNKD